MNRDHEIEKINSCISDLVYDKVQLRKAYNYYHCKRDPEQFKHIEDNYGIGTPTSIGFTPLIKKHIDVLIGEYLELDPDLQISCKDEDTVTDIMRDKQLKIHEAAFNFFKERLQNAILKVFQGDSKDDQLIDPFFNKELERIKKLTDDSYISEYEKAAQNILNYIKHSRDIDLKNKMRELFTDIFIGGTGYYRVRPNRKKDGLRLEICNPLDTFVERNFNEYFLNKSPRAVIRKYLTVEQVLAEYYDELSKDARELLKTKHTSSKDNESGMYVRVSSEHPSVPGVNQAPGILGGLEAHPIRGESNSIYTVNSSLIEVYECEWIEYKEKEDMLVRHEGVKIGDEIYITRGESEMVTRSISHPKECTLSINGIFFSDRNGDPFSIVLNTMDLQDWLY